MRAGVVAAQRDISLTFGPTDGFYPRPQAPLPRAVTSIAAAIFVDYDLTNLRVPGQVGVPQLYLSRVAQPLDLRPDLAIPLTNTRGTIEIPYTLLKGAGIYGFAIHVSSLIDRFNLNSDITPVRYDPAHYQIPVTPYFTDPIFPELGRFHMTISPDQSALDLNYRVTNIDGATDAGVEVSAPGPVAGTDGQLFTFNNPNSSVLDRGIVPSLDSVRFVPLPGRSDVARLDGRALFDLGAGFGITTGFYNLRVFGRDGEGDLLGDASHSISVRLEPTGGIEEIALPTLADAVALNPETNVTVVPVGGVGLAARFKGISLVDLSERRVRRTLPIDDLAFDACVIPKTNTAVVIGMTPILGAFRGNVYVIDLGDETIRATIPITAFAPTSVACNPVTLQALVGG